MDRGEEDEEGKSSIRNNIDFDVRTRTYHISKTVRVYNYSVYQIYFFTRTRFQADEFLIDRGALYSVVVIVVVVVVVACKWAKEKK